MSGSVIHKLETLEYRGMNSLSRSFNKTHDLRKIVLWNECENVRALPMEERRWMENMNVKDTRGYSHALDTYLGLLEVSSVIRSFVVAACTDKDDEKCNRARILLLDTILGMGVNLRYMDEKTKYNIKWNQEDTMLDAEGMNRLEELSLEDLLVVTRPLFKQFNFPTEMMTTEHVLSACREIYRRCFHELSILQSSTHNTENNVDVVKHRKKDILGQRKTVPRTLAIPDVTKDEAYLQLDKLMSVDLGDTDATRVQTLLKLIHTSELELLQCNVNELISYCQEASVNQQSKD